MHLRYRDELPEVVARELDSLIAQLRAKLFLEHNEDGSHRGSSLVSASDPANADESDSDTGVVSDAGRHWKTPGPWLFDERGAANEHMVGLRPPVLAAGTYNDYAPQGINDAVILEIEPDGGTVTLTGLRQHQGIARNKRMLLIRNRDSAESLILVHNSASSSTGSRFFLPGNANVTMGPGQNIWLYYDPAKDGWTAAITPHLSGGLGTGAASTNALLDGTNHTDTVAQGVTRGSLIYGNSTPKWDELILGAANRFLKSDGTDAAWGQVDLASGDVTGVLPSANGGTLILLRRAFTELELESINSSPVTIVAAPGADKILIPVLASFELNVTTGYSTSPTLDINYATIGTTAVNFNSMSFTTTGRKVTSEFLTTFNFTSATDPRNRALVMSASADPGTPGTGVATGVLNLFYTVHTVT